ncbi:MAG TPA: glycine zipper 2TM domain-containing protein [Rhizomicrobium sp.]
MRKIPAIAATAMLLLAGCASTPEGPSFAAMPGQGKSLQAFDRDDYDCQGYASNRVAGRVDRANDKTAANTILGAAIGAGLGAAVGDTKGAVVGGTAGGLIGNASSDPGYKQYGVQREYDAAYAQCMTSRGNVVPGPRGPRYHGDYPPPPPGYGPPPPPDYYGPPPPPRY